MIQIRIAVGRTRLSPRRQRVRDARLPPRRRACARRSHFYVVQGGAAERGRRRRARRGLRPQLVALPASRCATERAVEVMNNYEFDNKGVTIDRVGREVRRQLRRPVSLRGRRRSCRPKTSASSKWTCRPRTSTSVFAAIALGTDNVQMSHRGDGRHVHAAQRLLRVGSALGHRRRRADGAGPDLHDPLRAGRSRLAGQLPDSRRRGARRQGREVRPGGRRQRVRRAGTMVRRGHEAGRLCRPRPAGHSTRASTTTGAGLDPTTIRPT